MVLANKSGRSAMFIYLQRNQISRRTRLQGEEGTDTAALPSLKPVECRIWVRWSLNFKDSGVSIQSYYGIPPPHVSAHAVNQTSHITGNGDGSVVRNSQNRPAYELEPEMNELCLANTYH